MLSGIIFINHNGLRWRNAPSAYHPHKTLYTRWKRWSDKGIFARMMAGLAAGHGEEKTVMIDAIYLKAHRTATSLGVKKRGLGRLIGRTKGGMKIRGSSQLVNNLLTAAGATPVGMPVPAVSEALSKAAKSWLGHRKGGVAMASVGACAGFGAICGSSLATAATMSRVALPELKRYGHSGRLSTATLAASGTLGILIPRSVVLVI